MNILSLHEASLNLADKNILNKASWQIHEHDKIALLGRNGAGKSTILSLLAGTIELDSGKIQRKSGLSVHGLLQAVPDAHEETVYDFLVQALGPAGAVLSRYRKLRFASDDLAASACQIELDALQLWDYLPQIESMAQHLSIDPDRLMKDLSGGMKRRVLLAASLIAAPDLLLLDEPTNHLDLTAIQWLESYLKTKIKTYIVVTHDRAFMQEVATEIVELDRGALSFYRGSYVKYLEVRESSKMAALKEDALFDKNLAAEELWLRSGIKARRTRNEGRVRALKAMRNAAAERRKELGQINWQSINTSRSGQLVLEATALNYSIGQKKIIKDFSFLMTKGDKVGILGPNGCGKTTLLRLILSELKPDSGQLRMGTSLSVVYFDQLRQQLDESKTIFANLGAGGEFLNINGKEKHVATYLQDFLFSPKQFHQPVSILSGGERSRLILAKLLANPVNLLIMDEPTNDLDMDTLDLLESILVDYTGSLLLVTHDRSFINHVVTSLLVFEADGSFHEFFGDYDDYKNWQESKEEKIIADKIEPKRTIRKRSHQSLPAITVLTKEIENLEKKIATLHEVMADLKFYERTQEAQSSLIKELKAYEEELVALYDRWTILETQK